MKRIEEGDRKLCPKKWWNSWSTSIRFWGAPTIRENATLPTALDSHLTRRLGLHQNGFFPPKSSKITGLIYQRTFYYRKAMESRMFHVKRKHVFLYIFPCHPSLPFGTKSPSVSHHFDPAKQRCNACVTRLVLGSTCRKKASPREIFPQVFGG